MKTKTKSKPEPPNAERPEAGPRTRTRLRSEATARQATTSTIPNSSGSLPRHGKIARLPAEIRESLNRALAQGVSGPQVLEWLNGLPGAQAVLREHFNGQPVSLQNLSQWRRGGFRDWLLKQEAKEVFSEFAVHHRSLAALQLTDNVAVWLGSRLVAMAGWVDQQGPEESWPVVHQMIRDVATLRRADYQIRQQKLREEAQHKLNQKELQEWALQPEVLAWLCREAEAKKKDKRNAYYEATFQLIGSAGNNPEDREWEARKRGVPIEQLDEARAAEEREFIARHQAKMAEMAAAKAAKANASACAQAAQSQSPKAASSEIKADKGKSKCESASPTETPNTKNQTPITTCGGAELPQPIGQVRPVRQSEAPSQSSATAAPAKPQREITPADLEMFLDQCDCGSKGRESAEQCPRCHVRAAMEKKYCVCHDVWRYRRVMREIEQYEREKADLNSKSP